MVASQLRRRILLGELNEGDKLPSESDMLTQFGVSRPTLREALRLLEAEGLVSTSRGSRNGATVHRPSVHIAARYMGFLLQANQVSFDDMYHTWLLIEPEVIRLIVEQRSPEAVRILREHNAQIELHLNDPQQFAASIADFHRVLVELAGIATLTYLMDLINRLLELYVASATTATAQQKDVSAANRKGQRSREKLIDLIEAGDAEGASEHWRVHMAISGKAMLRAHQNTPERTLSSYA